MLPAALHRLALLAVACLALAGCAQDPVETTDTTATTTVGAAGPGSFGPAPRAPLGPVRGSGLDDGLGRGGAATQQALEEEVGARIYFGTDRSDLDGEARATLDRQAAWLQRYAQVDIVIEGHADERGTREYNLALGERRATAVRNYLVAQGVDTARITTISYGKERPAVLGSGEAAWAQNRRAVTVVQ